MNATRDGVIITTEGTTFKDIIIMTEPNREAYEEELKERQRRHLEEVRGERDSQWQPCMHDSCTECHGTGIRRGGGMCVHMIACPCPKCSPRFST